MGRIVSVVNQKGGVGKTTTAINLAACLAAAEKRVLLIDFDPQGNATSGIGIDKDNVGKTIYHAIIDDVGVEYVIKQTEVPYLQMIPSNSDLIGAEIELVGMDRREFRLSSIIKSILNRYDYILIDCPPSLGLLTVNALIASQSVIIPLQCEYYALEGLTRLLETVKLINQGFNSQLVIEGILLTMFDARNNICRQVEKDVREHFKDEVFKTVIPRNVRLSEAPSFGKPIIMYDIKSKGAFSYLTLAQEFMC